MSQPYLCAACHKPMPEAASEALRAACKVLPVPLGWYTQTRALCSIQCVEDDINFWEGRPMPDIPRWAEERAKTIAMSTPWTLDQVRPGIVRIVQSERISAIDQAGVIEECVRTALDSNTPFSEVCERVCHELER